LFRCRGGVTKEDIQSGIRAMDGLCRGQHPNIVKILNSGLLEPHGGYYFMDMELCDAHLADFLASRGLSKQQFEWPDSVSYLWEIMGNIASGLEFIHSKLYVHRDLKPTHGIVRCYNFANVPKVLYQADTKTWKLAGFDSCSKGDSREGTTTPLSRGPPRYRAPELLSEGARYTNKVDIWAFGSITCELVTGRMVFSSDHEVLAYSREWGDLTIPAINSAEFGVMFERIIRGTLERDPQNRPILYAKRKLRATSEL
jgi:serine/threonine protein kinase